MKRKRTKMTRRSKPTNEEIFEDVKSTSPGTSHSFHNDEGERKTVVEVDGKIYDLVLTDLTVDDLKDLPSKELPHVRRLNAITVKDLAQTRRDNEEAIFMHELNGSSEDGSHTKRHSRNKVTSIRKATKMGVDIGKEVARLLKLKEEATDEAERKKLRKQLRKLDYKRYVQEGE